MADTTDREIKESQSLETFKQKIKLNRNFNCSCRLCKNFVTNLGFSNTNLGFSNN